MASVKYKDKINFKFDETLGLRPENAYVNSASYV